MSMKPTFNVVIPRNYTKDGEEKTAWERVGTIFMDKDTGKMSLKIQALPMELFNGDNAGWCNIFKIQPRENAIEGAKRADANGVEPDDEPINLDDIPF